MIENNLDIKAVIELGDGLTFSVEMNEKLYSQIKKEYKINEVKSEHIVNFFEGVIIDAFRNEANKS